MEKADRETLRRINKQVILGELRKNDLSRTELAKVTNLSHSTVSALVNELIRDNISFEKSVAESSGGRRPVILSINPDAAYALLFKITPDRIKAAVVDLKLQIVYQKTFDCTVRDEASAREAINRSLNDVLTDQKAITERLFGVGISVSGLVDNMRNRVMYSVLLNLREFDIAEIVKSRLQKEVYLFKDTDALMLGERILNDFSDLDSYLYILVENGVGLSFMNKGEVLQLNKSGLEIGHVKLETGGPKCQCGKFGCVEAYVSEMAAIRDLKEILPESEHEHIDRLTYADIVARSNDGEPAFRKVILKQCLYLGKAVGCAINIFAPNLVLIGGPLSEVNWDINSTIARSVNDSVLNIYDNVKVKFTNTGDKSSFIGMAERIFDKEFFII
jgi:predicted NBD/HSP70 family sugar kinase